jgi:hypothetical protein
MKWKSTHAAIAQGYVGEADFQEKRLSGGRSSGTAERADRLKFRSPLLVGYESCDGRGGLNSRRDGSLRDNGVANMAELAVLLRVGLSVPVADGMGAPYGDGKDHDQRQKTKGDSFRHVSLDSHGHLFYLCHSSSSNRLRPRAHSPLAGQARAHEWALIGWRK